MTDTVIVQFRPLRRGTLVGFVRVRFGSGLVLDDVSVHRGSDNVWCNPPARAMLDQQGNTIRDPNTGKVKYAGLIDFATTKIRASWQRQIIEALHVAFPHALDSDEPPTENPPG
jgi:hypothetical protein